MRKSSGSIAAEIAFPVASDRQTACELGVRKNNEPLHSGYNNVPTYLRFVTTHQQMGSEWEDIISIFISAAQKTAVLYRNKQK